MWKTSNNGHSLEPLFDDMPTMIMGDIAIDPNNPETIWVGTGENNSSRSSYGGMGIYRSDDGGQNWRHMGLGDTDRIGRILIDPNDSDRIYFAALGKLYSAGGQREIYRSTDGGKNWQQILAGGDWTGIIDMVFKPDDVNTIYAASWERKRRPWDFSEGGMGSAIYKSTDGGDSWSPLDGGLPGGDFVGRIGLAVSTASPNTLYASIDNQQALPEDQWNLSDHPINAKRPKNRWVSRVEASSLADTPYAESVRLGHALYAIPGEYTIRVGVGENSESGKLKIKAPKDYQPRFKESYKLRGK